MQEVYRTLLGHFRHEMDIIIGKIDWGNGRTPAFSSFSESSHYEEALKITTSQAHR